MPAIAAIGELIETAMKISVQLYTIRSLMEKDFWGTLTRLSEAGFRNVELAGLGGHDAEEARIGFAERGLKPHSMHVDLNRVKTDQDALVQEAHTLGVGTVIVPWIDHNTFKGGWKEIAEVLTSLAKLYAEHDLKLGYHNHAFEFEKEGDRTGFEILWESAGPEVVPEVDLFWVKKGGDDPIAWINKLTGRIKEAHFKDMDPKGEFTEVGQGSMDWDGIIKAGKEAGLEYAIIENDSPKIDPLESVTKSREFLLSKGLKD
ncbi:MAG: sugar phosphate isomerase/epimerase family protein [Fimbriimonadaceae bacterium]